MKIPPHKNIITDTSPRYKYISKANCWCLTSFKFDEQKGWVQHQVFYSDDKYSKPIVYSDKKFI